MEENNRVNTGGLLVYPFISFNEMLDFVKDKKKILVAVNSNKLRLAKQESIKTIVNNNIGYADSRGEMLVLHQKGYVNAIQIPGCELWLHMIEEFKNTKSFYFIGGTQSVISKTMERIGREYPELDVRGSRNGFLTEGEQETLVDDIVRQAPDVVFVAMGSPRQERLMEKMLSRHPALYLGLGGSFDVYTDTVTRVPEWWRKHNMEGIYKTIKTGRWNRLLWTIEFYIKYKLHLY